MASKASQRAGTRLVPSSRVLSNFARERLEAEQAILRKLLAQQELEYRGGDRASLALGINISGLLGEPLPGWIAQAWSKACTDIETRAVGSWDQVLGNAPPATDKQQRREQIERERVGRLLEVLPLRATVSIKKGDPQGSFFWFAARYVGIDAPALRKLYYKHKLHQHRSLGVK